MANVSRPAQGNNSYRPLNWPGPAYVQDAAPPVMSSGTLSNPKSVTGKFRGKTTAANVTPKIVNL